MPTVLLIEDDERLSHLVTRYLESHHYTVMQEQRGQAALQRVSEMRPDIVLLDLGLPDMDGMDVCRQMRASYDGLLLIFSARGDDINQVLGLELGADDYLPKPMQPAVLLARLRAHLRRQQQLIEPTSNLSFGELQIDPDSRTVVLNGETVPLTTSEFDLLLLLARNPGQVIHRDTLFKGLRGIDFDGMDRSIDARVSRLRRKLGDSDPDPVRIRTVRGRGYLFSPNAWQ